MTLLWIGIALLVLVALGWLLPSLWRPRAAAPAAAGANVAVYRDQLQEAERDLAADLITPERFEQLKAEIQRRVLEDTAADAAPAAATPPARRTAIALALVLPLASVATYLALGQPQAVQTLAADAARQQVGAEDIEAMVARLAERLKAEPGNAEGWRMLARSHAALGRYADAVAALRKLDELQPDNPDTLSDLADVIGMSQSRQLSGEPTRLVQRALAINPQHPKALALAGTIAFDAGDYRAAREQWQRLAALLPADSELARAVQGSIDEATTRLAAVGGAAAPAVTPAPSPAPASAPAAADARLTGEVSLSPELAARVAAGDTVFVFARAAEGPRMPLAVVRQPVAGWPLRFTLDDSSAMSPQSRLSGARMVVVVARISKSGQAMPQSGDLIGESAPVSPPAQGLRIVIDRVQP